MSDIGVYILEAKVAALQSEVQFLRTRLEKLENLEVTLKERQAHSAAELALEPATLHLVGSEVDLQASEVGTPK